MSTIALRTFVGDTQPSANCPIGSIWIDTTSTPAVKVCTVANTTFASIGAYIGSSIPSGATIDAPVITGAITRTGYAFSIPACHGVAGATAGFTVGGEDASHARCPASQTGATFVLPIPIHVGDIITSYKLNGQIESAGNAVTVDCDIYESTMVAGDITEASKSAAITQVSATADAVIAATKSSLSITKATAKPLYFLITVTTAAATDVAIADIELTVTQK